MSAPMIEDIESESAPFEAAQFHVVQRFPIQPSGTLCPLLILHAGDSAIIDEGAKFWAMSRLADRGDQSIASDLRVLGRVHDFQQIAWNGEPVDDSDRNMFLWGYLDARHHGTNEHDNFAALNWGAVPLTSVKSDLRSLASYFKFQRDQGRWAEEGFRTPAALVSLSEMLHLDKERRRSDFYNHLSQSRARWAKLFGQEGRLLRLVTREMDGSATTFSLNRTFDLEEVNYLISREPNPVYRAFWILGGFGGLRISEMLHMWQCDLLPPSTGVHVAGRKQDTLFGVVAHPSESKYLGDFSKQRETRLQHLARRYGLRPRHHIRGYRRAGWKNPLLTDPVLKLSEIFWSNNEQARALAECYAEVRHFHSRNKTSEKHPYLWVNLTRNSGFAEPVAYSKAREALHRACTRVDLTPMVSGRRIHGLRHLYKRQLDILKLSPDYIQIAMRHRSLESQEDYARTSAEIRAHLEGNLSWRTTV